MLKMGTCPLCKFQQAIGELHHAALILPSAKGLFTPISEGLRHNQLHIGLGKRTEVRGNFLDLLTSVHSLTKHPTHISKIVPGAPNFISFYDASTAGAGGMWFAPRGSAFTPIVWRLAFPVDVTTSVVSASNPTRAMSNSDLKLAAPPFPHLGSGDTGPTQTYEHCHFL